MESFEQQLKQYEPMIHRITRSLNIYKNKDEFYQVGRIGLWEASKRFDSNKGNFTNYAYTFIKGLMLLEMNKSKRHEERTVYPENEFWEIIENPIPDKPLVENTLEPFCKNLTENQRKWLVYTCVNGLTVKEIAEKEKVSISAVKNWRSCARGKLKNLMIDFVG